jgi:hypothetical protein
MINNYSVRCHFKNEYENLILEYIKNKNNPVLAIPAGVAIILKNNSYKVVGSSPAYVFNIDNSKLTLFPDKTYLL